LRLSSALRTVALGAVAVGFATPLVRHRLGLPRRVVSVLAWQAPLSLALARPRSAWRDAGIYALQMWAYIAHYEMPNDDPEQLLRRLKVNYPIRADRAIGRGQIPTVVLQRALGSGVEGEVRLHDKALSIVHWAWFVVPHASLAYILLRHREHFPRSACFVAGVFDTGCIVYWMVPTAPPWWASRNGNLPAPVRRIMVEVGEQVGGRLWRPAYDSLSGNQFAAMPSLHFATSVMAAHVLSDVGRISGVLGWGYASALGFALVYLGEHYVIDLVAGLALAEAVRRVGPAATPAISAMARAIQRLEPVRA